jgi:FixJ family two-component response regulator
MTGLELQAELVRRGWQQPVIVMTAFPTDAAREQAMDGGAQAFLTKPIDPDALLDAVGEAIA